MKALVLSAFEKNNVCWWATYGISKLLEISGTFIHLKSLRQCSRSDNMAASFSNSLENSLVSICLHNWGVCKRDHCIYTIFLFLF